MIYFPPNGYLRRVCVGNLNMSLALLTFCLRFYRDLTGNITDNKVKLFENKDLIMYKLY